MADQVPQQAEKDVEHLRQEYNVAVANGLVMRAKRIARRLDAVQARPSASARGADA